MRSMKIGPTVLAAALLASSCGSRSSEPAGKCAPPQAPSGLHVVSMNGTTVVLAWTAAPAATSYIVEAGSAPGKSEQLRTPVQTVGYTATDVKAGTYYTRVLGTNACGDGPVSNELTVVVP